MAITPFKVIQGHRFWYRSKAHIRLPISDKYLLSYTVSKLWLIIGQIFARDSRVPHFNTLAGSVRFVGGGLNWGFTPTVPLVDDDPHW